MSFLIVFLVGGLWSVVCVAIGISFKKQFESLDHVESIVSQKIFPTRKQKKKPKAISEIDEWKKEQNNPPSDPGR